jgi:hypothetical protein
VLRNITYRRKIKIFHIIYDLIYYAHAILCACGILSHIFKEEHGMTAPDNSLLGENIAPKREKVTRGGRK